MGAVAVLTPGGCVQSQRVKGEWLSPTLSSPRAGCPAPTRAETLGTFEIGRCVPWSLLLALQHFFESRVVCPLSWFAHDTPDFSTDTHLPSGKPLSPRQTRKAGHPEASDTN